MRRNPAAQTKRYRHLVTLYRERPEHYLTLRECVSPEFLALFLDDSVNLAFGDRELSKRRADIGINLAEVVGDRHLRTRALFQLAQYYRIEESKDEALEVIFQMEDNANDCLCCLSLTFQIAGILFHHFKEDRDIALLCFNEAIQFAKQRGNDGLIAKILISRGYHLHYAHNNPKQALRDYEQAQRFLPKDAPSIFTTAVLANTAYSLLEGDDADFVRAKLVLANAREWLKGLPDLTIVRYYITWIDGHLKIKTGERTEGIVLLNRAADGFKKMELENYYLAVQADLAKIYLQKRTFYAIRRLFKSKVQFLTEESQKLIERIRDTVKREDEPTLRDLLNEMRQAQDVMIPELV